MKWLGLLLISVTLSFCTPKGPQTFDSNFIGKSKQELIETKGLAKEIRIVGDNEIHIYKSYEEYYGKKEKPNQLTPKRTYVIEYIYYINKDGFIYKYQVWRKKIK